MRLGFYRKNISILALIILAVIILAIPSTSHAEGVTGKVAGWLAKTTFEETMLSVLTWVFEVTGKFLAFMVWLMGVVVNLPVYSRDMPVIYENWKIMRDFANLMFILALIVMAYGTIFKVQNYSFKSEWFFKIVMYAVIVNFSLVIGTIVIQAFQILTNTMLQVIGNGDIAAKFGQGLKIQNVFSINANNGQFQSVASAISNSVLSLIMVLILMFAVLSVTVVVTMVAIARIPIIWGLLIIAPIAWVINAAFPNNKTKFDWWGEFIGWNAFLPIFLFCFYLGLTVLTRQSEVLSAIAKDYDPNQPLLQNLGAFSLQTIFTYVLAIFVMIFGLRTGLGMRNKLKSGYLTKMLDKRAATPMAAFRNIPFLGVRAESAAAVFKARQQEFGQRGFKNRWLNKMYGGKEGDERIAAGYMTKGGLFTGGFKGPEEKRGAMAGQIAKERDRNKALLGSKSTEELRAMEMRERKVRTMTDGARLAMLEILKERGALSSQETYRLFERYRGMDSSGITAEKYAKDLDFEKLDKDTRNLFRDSINKGHLTNEQTVKKIQEARVKKGDVENATDIATLAQQLFNKQRYPDDAARERQMGDFIKLAEENSFLSAEEARLIAQLTKDPVTKRPKAYNNANLEDAIRAATAKGKIKDEEIVKYIKSTSATPGDSKRRGVVSGMRASTARRIADNASPADRTEFNRIADEIQYNEMADIVRDLNDQIAALPAGAAARRTALTRKRDKIKREYGIP